MKHIQLRSSRLPRKLIFFTFQLTKLLFLLFIEMNMYHRQPYKAGRNPHVSKHEQYDFHRSQHMLPMQSFGESIILKSLLILR